MLGVSLLIPRKGTETVKKAVGSIPSWHEVSRITPRKGRERMKIGEGRNYEGKESIELLQS